MRDVDQWSGLCPTLPDRQRRALLPRRERLLQSASRVPVASRPFASACLSPAIALQSTCLSLGLSHNLVKPSACFTRIQIPRALFMVSALSPTRSESRKPDVK